MNSKDNVAYLTRMINTFDCLDFHYASLVDTELVVGTMLHYVILVSFKPKPSF